MLCQSRNGNEKIYDKMRFCLYRLAKVRKKSMQNSKAFFLEKKKGLRTLIDHFVFFRKIKDYFGGENIRVRVLSLVVKSEKQIAVVDTAFLRISSCVT